MNVPMHLRYAHGGSLRRFASIKPKGRGITLAADHAAVREARTIFPTTVNAVGEPRLKRLLKGGENSRKIGKRVMKGKLKGFPIFTLTLEERATCPRSCDVDLIRHLSERAHAERAPGQTLQSKLNELRREWAL